MKALAGARIAVSNFDPPMAVGEVRYLDPRHINEECETFRAVLDAADGSLTEAFVTAPSPGIVASAMRNDWYDSDAAYLEALAEALRVEYEAIIAHGFVLQLDCPDLALERHLGGRTPACVGNRCRQQR